jgi:dTDP-4-dehydrorhamnose reductase
MKVRVAIIGADGQLGRDVALAFQRNADEVYNLGHAQLEICDIESVRTALMALRPDIVVTTAAFHNVEKCEADPVQAFAVNGAGTRNVAQTSAELGARMIYISTDYVFDGWKKEPYVETDSPRPLNVYGNTKLAGEYFIRSISPQHFVLRTSAIYGKHPCRAKGGPNFVDLMCKLGTERDEVKVVDNQFVTPTPTTDIARLIVKLSRSDAYGLYHATGEGSCSWYEFAAEIFRLTNASAQLRPAGPGDFSTRVDRPKYSVLENHNLKAIGMNVFQPWQNSLRQYLAVKGSAVAS